MILLDTLQLSSLTWSILAFSLIQLIAGIKFILNLYARIKVLEKDLADNTQADQKDEDTTKAELIALDKACKETYKTLDNKIEGKKNLLFKAIKESEEKCERRDKELTQRVNNIAQGLSRSEEKLKAHDKAIDKIEQKL